MAAMLIIGFVWLIVVGSAAMKIRAERLESIDSFQRQLRAFAPGLPALDDRPVAAPGPGAPAFPDTAATTELLRRILGALLVTVGVSFLYALAVSTRLAWGIHLLIDNTLLAYLALLVHRRDNLSSLGAAEAPSRARLAMTGTVRRTRLPAAMS